MGNEQHAEIIRSMIRHENDLRNQRLGWLLTLNGLLFTGLGLAWGSPHTEWLTAAYGFVGVVVGVSAAATMKVSDIAIGVLKSQVPPAQQVGQLRTAQNDPLVAPVTAVDSRYFLSERGRVWGVVPLRAIPALYLWNVAPWLLALVWLGLLILGFTPLIPG